MGCDIHLYTEKRREDKWHNCDNWRLDCEGDFQIYPLLGQRNYDLFAVLANVRNYGETEYIDKPRGIPEIVSPQVQKEYEKWHGDGHSHSWFSLAELRQWQDNHPTVKHRGLVSRQAADRLDQQGILPRSWCQGSSDRSLVWRTWFEMYSPLDELIERLERRMKEVFWLFGDSWPAKLERDIRIVFWFDN